MQNATILIVDDNEDVRQFVRASLEQEGFQVCEAVDGNISRSQASGGNS
jgi:DNA-binding response OmpR family regulator